MLTSVVGTSAKSVSSPTANVAERQYALSRGGTQRSSERAEATTTQAFPLARRSSAEQRAATTASSGALSLQGRSERRGNRVTRSAPRYAASERSARSAASSPETTYTVGRG